MKPEEIIKYTSSAEVWSGFRVGRRLNTQIINESKSGTFLLMINSTNIQKFNGVELLSQNIYIKK